MELLMQYTNDKVSLENDSLKYNPMISLRDIASVKIVTNLWMHEKSIVLKNISENTNISCPRYDDSRMQRKEKYDWINAKTNVFYKILQLPLPKSVINICWFDSISECVEYALKVWIKHHKSILRISSKYFDDIKWTVKGKVDYKRTAYHILQQQSLPLEYRLEIACSYCFEEEVVRIFPVIKPQYFIEFATHYTVAEKPMLFYFMNYLLEKNSLQVLNYFGDLNKGQGEKSIEEYVLQQILVVHKEHMDDHHLVALEYLWNKLTTQEKINNIIIMIKYCGNNDLRYSILSALNKAFQKEVIKGASLILVDMPECWYSINYFLPTVIYVLDILTADAYKDILQKLIDLVIDAPKSMYISNNVECFKVILNVFWENSPKHLQASLLKNNDIVYNIALLVKDNIDFAQLLLSDVQSHQKKEAISSPEGLEVCENIILYKNLKLLKVFVSCFIGAEKNIKMFKHRLFYFKGVTIINRLLGSEKWDEMENFMKWALGNDEDIEVFKKDLMSRKKYELQDQNITHCLSLSDEDIECVQKLYSKSF